MAVIALHPDQQPQQTTLRAIPRPILCKGDVALNTADIAHLLGCRRAHATNRVTKLSDFPAPAIDLSERMRWWSFLKVQGWLLNRQRPSCKR
ncbi:hypothetical protein [Acidovorax sp. Root217]|uniref:hypothetical protein n=1 Tax=Acidovorax sp. Root217 TaxID=1736492 RepID=UPI000710DC26|nr:hypothetical protein [Acidovorax sp. Root217]